MGIAERKIRQKEEVKSLILKAAWQLVQQEGWQALSIRKIADAIEYSSPVIYDHFANKEAIMLEFTRRGFQHLNEELLKAKKRFPSPEQQIEAMAYNYWDFAFKNKEFYQLMYGLGMPTCEMVKTIPEMAAFTELILNPIKEMIAQSKQPETNPYMKLHSFWSMLHGLISINMMSKDENKEESNSDMHEMNDMVLRDSINTFIAGIKA